MEKEIEKKEEISINLLEDNLIDENLLKVEDLPFEKFDRIKFYKKHNIEYITDEEKENITMDMAKKEIAKITDVKNGTGFAYFFLEYCKVSHPTRGSIVIKDDAYKWQVNAAVDFLKHRYVVSLKSRQVAFSTTVGAYALWRALFFDSQRIVVISKNQRDSTTFLERIKFIYEHLPIWLKQATSEFAKTSVTFAHNFSKITSLPNKGDPAQGESLSLLITDEFASYQDSQAILSAATPALSAGALTEFSNDCLPSQFFVISTLPRKNVVNNDYLRILHGAQDNPNSKFKLIEVEVDDIPHYRSKSWHMEMLETLGTRGYKIEVCKQEVYETEHSLIEGYILQNIKTKNPIRVDFINPEDVNEEGYYKDLNTFVKMRDNWDAEYKYLKGLWIWHNPVPDREYCVTCLPKGEKVLTTNGLKKIEDVLLNDVLYSKEGKETKIINKQITKVKNKNLYEISLDSIFQTTKFTGEHPIYASKSNLNRIGKNKPRFWEHDFKFYKAHDIKKGDWLLFPNIYKLKETTEEEMKNYFNNTKTKRYDFDLNDEFILDEKIWWYIGIWLAEGWASIKGNISTAHHIKENFLIEEFESIFNKYNRNIYYTEKPEENGLVIHLHIKHFANFLNNTFGKGAKNKSLPEWVKFLPKKYKLQLIKGYLLGDGCIINKQEEASRKMLRTNFVSISYKLLKDIQDVLFSLGITSNLNLMRNEKKSIIKDKIINQQKTYNLNVETWESLKLLSMLKISFSFPNPKHRKQISTCYLSEDENFIYIRVKDNKLIQNYNGYVYNFETEDHTYLCDYISTHNCDVAGGESNDFCAFHVFDLMTNIQVAEYKGKVNTEQYKEVLLTICEYYNNAKLSVERNGLGINICQYFGDTINYEKFYWHQKTKKTFISGFPMYEPIRSHAIAYLENYLTKKEIIIQSIRTVNELRNFGMSSRGKIKAISGNDDLVMALCQYCYLQQINWAVSEETMINDNLLGIDIEDEEEEKKGIKYWEDEFDLSEKDQEILRFAKITGSSVNINNLDF